MLTVGALLQVRCERVVPIRGVEDMFKKSSVIVTRLIEIDMEATEERQRLYKRIMRGHQQQAMIEGSDGRRTTTSWGGVRKLNTQDTFNLYKTFMGVAEAAEGSERERVKIERRIEDQKNLPEQAEFEFSNATMGGSVRPTLNGCVTKSSLFVRDRLSFSMDFVICFPVGRLMS